jgi:hypothetical protein
MEKSPLQNLGLCSTIMTFEQGGTFAALERVLLGHIFSSITPSKCYDYTNFEEFSRY